jgi:hypothetical protein
LLRKGAAVLGLSIAAVVLGGALWAPAALADAGLSSGPPSVALLAGSASADLSQVSAGQWTTTVYLDTASLCDGTAPAGNTFTLVTGEPDSVTEAAPAYPGGQLSCGGAAAPAVTEVQLSFTPSLSAVPQSADLVVTPPRALLFADDPPFQVPLTVRRAVSPWQYVGIPAVCGAALAVLLVLALLLTGLPAAAGAGRARRGPEFWRTPLFAGAAWSFGDSWATSVTPLSALAGGILAASGAVAGLVPGVDLARFGLLMALVGGLTTLAPLLFAALNALFPPRCDATAAPPGEVSAASLWVMLLASCVTVFAIGAELGYAGVVLGFDLLVASPSVRWIGPAATALAALLFLAYGLHSLRTLTGQPPGTPKPAAQRSSFML